MSRGFLLRPLVPTALSVPSSPAAPTAAIDMLNDMVGVAYTSGAGGSTDNIDVDFGSAVSIDTVALLQTNGAAANWTLRGAATQAGLPGASDIFSATFAAGSATPSSGRTHALGVLAAPLSFRWWRIGLSGLTAPIQVGRLIMGLRFQPDVNFSFGAALGVEDLAGGEFSRHGVWLPGDGRIQRTLGLRWPHATRTEAEEQVSVLMETVGNRGHVLACLDPTANAQRQRRLYYGPLRGNLQMVWNVGQRFEWRADLRSVI
jgi:hypothetical protein